MARGVVRIRSRELQLALRDFRKLGRKSGVESVNKAAGFWTSFAYADTRKSSKQKVRSELMQKVSAPSGVTVRNPRGGKGTATLGAPVKGGALGNQFRGTRAARIVGAKIKKQGIRKITPQRFYQRVRNFVAMRVRSVGYWKAGFIPSLRAFRQKGQRSRGGRFKQPIPGRAKRATARAVRVHAFLENSADDFAKRESHVISKKAAQVARLLRRFTVEDYRRNARKARLRR